MNKSPLTGGAMRRRRSRRAPLVLTVLLLPIAAFGVWLFLGSKATREPPPPAAVNGHSIERAQHGRRVPVEALLAGMLLPSGNDAAIALADRVSGHAAPFVKLMNRTARRMGLGCTRYASPDGLSTKNRSCAADLAALARIAIAKPRIARLTGQEQVHVRFPIKTGKLWLSSTNPLL